MLFVPTRNSAVMLNGGQKSLPTLHLQVHQKKQYIFANENAEA